MSGPERDFDDIVPEDRGDKSCAVQVKLESFKRSDDVNYSFTSEGYLKIWTNVGGKVYSKIFQNVTQEHVELPPQIETSTGSFKVILKKKKDFKIKESFCAKDFK